MSETEERYRVSEGSLAAQDEPVATEPAGCGRRFANYVIDTICQIVLLMIVTFVAALMWGDVVLERIESIPDLLLGVLILCIYYIPFEAASGRTLGKWITGTKVVNEEGRRPSLKQVLGRTLARLIPFEAFTFFRSDARGIHDSLPKTFVVRAR